MDDIDEQLDKIEQRQANMLHEAKLHNDVEYAMEQLGLPEIMAMLEHLSSKLDRYGHTVCVNILLNRLKEM